MVKGLKKVAKGLEKASKTHAKQAKMVKKHILLIDLEVNMKAWLKKI